MADPHSTFSFDAPVDTTMTFDNDLYGDLLSLPDSNLPDSALDDLFTPSSMATSPELITANLQEPASGTDASIHPDLTTFFDGETPFDFSNLNFNPVAPSIEPQDVLHHATQTPRPTIDRSETTYPATLAYPQASPLPPPYIHRRSISQPPENMTFTRGPGMMIDRSMSPVPPSNVRPRGVKRLRMADTPKAQYGHPYPAALRATQQGQHMHMGLPTTPPRSVPTGQQPQILRPLPSGPSTPRGRTLARGTNGRVDTPGTPGQRDRAMLSRAEHERRVIGEYLAPDTERCIIGSGYHTTALQMMSYIDRTMATLELMRGCVRAGSELAGDERWMHLEMLRNELRKQNSRITELDHKLSILPLRDIAKTALDKQGNVEVPESPMGTVASPIFRIPHIPNTGLLLRDIPANHLMAMLAMYDIPILPDLMLFEKKALYLRFIGLGRELMEKIIS